MPDETPPPTGGVPAEAAVGDLEGLERQNRTLERRLRRMEENVRRLEDFQDSNSRLLSRLVTDLEEERARSRRLLLNVLPQRVVDRLNAGETQIADRHDDVTVLITDFVGFTRISAALPTQELIAELTALFSGFDAICDDTGIEKIKTIGDAYLAVGGLSDGPADHRVAAAEAALRMVELVASRGASDRQWQVRVGLAGGPVAAGVIGTTKFAYDVWGDTVNVASRLEASSLPGRIHVSEGAATALADRFRLEPRGEMELKGKGSMPTWFLVGRR
jgi:class 3 adenylate cyclase